MCVCVCVCVCVFCVPIYIYIYISGISGIKVTVLGNGHSDPSSNFA